MTPENSWATTTILSVGLGWAQSLSQEAGTAAKVGCPKGGVGLGGESVEFAEDNLSHIFRNAPGHLAEDTAANRGLLQGAVKAENFITADPASGVATYRQLLSNGKQVWVEVRNGYITNGGVNTIPR